MKVGWRGDIVGAVRADKKTRAVCQRESLRHTKESSARAITPEEEAQAQQGASQEERQHRGYTRARRVEARVWPWVTTAERTHGAPPRRCAYGGSTRKARANQDKGNASWE